MSKKIVYSAILVLICVAVMSLAWPLNLIYRKSDVVKYSDENDYDYLFLSKDDEINQKFKAEGNRLQSVELLIGEKTGDITGNLIFSIKNKKGKVISEKTISLRKLKCDSLNRVNFRDDIEAGKTYELHLSLDSDAYVTVGHITYTDADDAVKNVSGKLYQAGRKKRGVLACGYVFASRLDRNQTLAFWGVCMCVLLIGLALRSGEFRKIIVTNMSSLTNRVQIWFVCFGISMFSFSALISSVLHSGHPVTMLKGGIICICTIGFCILLLKDLYKCISQKKITIQFETAMVITMILCIAIRIPMLSDIPRWDAGEYYYRLSKACSSFDFSFNSFFSDFRLCGHSNLGFSFLMCFPEFLFPGNTVIMNIWNLILTSVCVYCIYWLVRQYWVHSSQWTAGIGAAVISSVPMFLGTFSYFNVDYALVLVFIYMVYCDRRRYNILCLWNTILLSQIKETGVVLVAGYWGMKLIIQYIGVLTSKNNSKVKLTGLLRTKSLWMGSISGALYMMYIVLLGGISDWTQNSDAESALGWDNDGFNCFGYKPGYVIYKLKQFGLLNFAWVWLAIIVVIGILLVQKKLSKKSEKYIIKIDMLGECGAIIAFILFSCLYITYALPRYNIIMSMMIVAAGVCVIVGYIEKRNRALAGGILTCMLVLMLVQSFYNIDPISKNVFENVNIGKNNILYSDYENDYFGDALVTNHQYTWLDKAYDKELNALQYRTGDAIMIPGQEWGGNFVGGNDASYNLYWDAEKKKRTFENTGNELLRHIINDTASAEGFMNKWYEGIYSADRTALIMYVPYYNTDIEEDIKRFESEYYIGSKQTVNVYGGRIDGFRLIRKEEYQGLSIADVLSSDGNGKSEDISLSDILNCMKDAGWSEEKAFKYAENLDLQQMKVDDSKEALKDDIIREKDCVDITVRILDDNEKQLRSFFTMQGDIINAFVVGSGLLGEEAENALIGHKVGDEVVAEIKVPDYITYVSNLCGDNMKVVINIGEKKGRVDTSSISEETQLNNYRIAYERVWRSYYKLALKKILPAHINDTNIDDDIDIAKYEKKVRRYFADYRSIAQLTEEEYLQEYVQLSEADYELAVHRLAISKSIKDKIDDEADEYKSTRKKEIEVDQSQWLLFE